MRRYVLAMAALLIMGSLIQAGGYCRSYAQSYYYPQYSQTYYYYPPSYNYQPVQLVPKAVYAEVSPDYYYSTAGYYQNKLMLEMLDIIRDSKGIPPKVTPPPTTPTPQRNFQGSVETPKPISTVSAETTETTAGDYQEPKLVAVMSESCNKCHNAKNPQRIALLTEDGKSITAISADKVWKAFGMVSAGDMPMNHDQLKDEEVRLFYDWAKAVSRGRKTQKVKGERNENVPSALSRGIDYRINSGGTLPTEDVVPGARSDGERERGAERELRAQRGAIRRIPMLPSERPTVQGGVLQQRSLLAGRE